MRINRTSGIAATLVLLAAGSIAIAQPAKKAETPTPSPEEMMAICMQACAEAATPGPEHAHLAKGVGTWNGKVTMYMPGMDPMKSECKTTITSKLDGRFVECATKGDMAEMGAFEGYGIYGFDNVSKQYTTIWYDSMGTGMAIGTGELSSDSKTMTWTLTYNCPVKKGPIQMRQIERVTGPDTMVLEMHGPNPLTGEVTKMMEIAYTRDSAHAGVSGGH